MPSPKISAKSLSYSSELPPFLRALHAQSGGGGGGSSGPDPILAGRRRAAKKRSDSEEAEDQPLVVDEHGNAVQLNPDGSAPADGAAAHDDKAVPADDDGGGGGETRAKEKLAAIGAGRKRKVGRVVGGEGPDASRDGAEGGDKKKTPDGEAETKPADAAKTAKKKKTAKKIKLSFDAE